MRSPAGTSKTVSTRQDHTHFSDRTKHVTMTTPDSQIIKERIAALKAQQPSFTTPDGQPMPSIPIQPKPAQFRKAGLLQQAKELSLSDDAKAIDELVEALPMQEAVNLWGKPQTDFKRTGANSVLIRCPNPAHPDRNPSANCDLEQGLFNCFGCDASGDKYALAALHHGIPDYQSGKNFVDLKHKIATDLGYTITETAGTTTLTPPATPQVLQPVDLNAVNPAPPAPAVQPLQQLDDGTWYDPSTGEITTPPAPTPQPVIQPVSFDDIEDEPELRLAPHLDWLPVGKNRSFLDRYMNCTQRDRYPDSLAFSAALTCLAFVGGRDVTIDMQDPIMGNFGMVMVANTGVGKSRAFAHAWRVLREVMPWKNAELAITSGGHVIPGHGVKAIPGSGSGENMIKQFEDTVKIQKGVDFKGDPVYEDEHYPVNGLISFNEFSQFVGKSSATGSTMRERVMDFLDGREEISNDTNTQGSYKAVKPFACMSTAVQPAVVHRLMSENDEASGFLNRFMFFTGSKKPRPVTKVPPVDMSDATAAMKELKAFWDAQGPTKIDDDAVWNDKYAYLKSVSDPLEENGSGIYGRLEALFHKLLILICINECSTVVTPDILDKAIHLHQYFIKTFEYVSEEMYNPLSTPSGKSAVSHNEDKIIERLMKVMKAKKDAGAQTIEQYGASAREIHTGTRKTINLEQLNRTLKQMVEIGALTSTQAGRKTVYTLNA